MGIDKSDVRFVITSIFAPTGHFRRAESWIWGLDIGFGSPEVSDVDSGTLPRMTKFRTHSSWILFQKCHSCVTKLQTLNLRNYFELDKSKRDLAHLIGVFWRRKVDLTEFLSVWAWARFWGTVSCFVCERNCNEDATS